MAADVSITTILFQAILAFVYLLLKLGEDISLACLFTDGEVPFCSQTSKANTRANLFANIYTAVTEQKKT